jgi:hypothetical protein
MLEEAVVLLLMDHKHMLQEAEALVEEETAEQETIADKTELQTLVAVAVVVVTKKMEQTAVMVVLVF